MCPLVVCGTRGAVSSLSHPRTARARTRGLASDRPITHALRTLRNRPRQNFKLVKTFYTFVKIFRHSIPGTRVRFQLTF